MCGICGIVSHKSVASRVIDGLHLLEYRGYDSAGIAVIDEHAVIQRRRASGKLENLEKLLADDPIDGLVGIGHTRWATHGKPTANNAHPHRAGDVAVVHNGIIENYARLRDWLERQGRVFATDTDTEVVAHLIDHHFQITKDPIASLRMAAQRLEGAYALGVIFAGHADLMLALRFGAPLAVGYGTNENFIGSDALALAPLTDTVAYLDDGDMAVLSREKVEMFDCEQNSVQRPKATLARDQVKASKNGYRHFMEKEIHEHPIAIRQTFASFNELSDRAEEKALDLFLGFSPDIGRLVLSGCGSAYYSARVAKYWLEDAARLWVEVDVASELRYRRLHIDPNMSLAALFISQSGETADTLGALRLMRAAGVPILSVLNTPHSSMARESDVSILMKAGPEISVASTKALTAQLTVLALLALTLGKRRGTLDEARHQALMDEFKKVPVKVQEVLADCAPLRDIAKELVGAKSVIFLGRGLLSPIADEGALKLKEITYIHAQSYAAGELKHGPISLIDEETPVIALAPSNLLFDKMLSNLREVHSRGGRIIALTDKKGAKLLKDTAYKTVILPDIDAFFTPFLYVIPLQILAFEVAVQAGTDVDQPRNLAKSVTVE